MLLTGSAFHAHFFAALHFGVTANHLLVVWLGFFWSQARFAESKIPIGRELRKVVLYCQETFSK